MPVVSVANGAAQIGTGQEPMQSHENANNIIKNRRHTKIQEKIIYIKFNRIPTSSDRAICWQIDSEGPQAQ